MHPQFVAVLIFLWEGCWVGHFNCCLNPRVDKPKSTQSNSGQSQSLHGCCSNLNIIDPRSTIHPTSLYLGSIMFFTPKHAIVFLGGGSTSHSSINERDVLCTDTFFISLLSCFCLQCHCEIQKIPLKKGVYERLTNIIFTLMDSFVYHPSTWMPLGECWCVRMYASVHLWGWSFIAWALLLFVSACVMHT